MNLKLYTPRGSQSSAWSGFETLNNRLVRLFDDYPANRAVPGSSTAARAGAWTPPVNVEETADTFVLTAEAPGLSLEDFSVELENNVLTISGEKLKSASTAKGEIAGEPKDSVADETSDEAVDGTRVHVSERKYGAFRRSFTLPRRVDGDRISARFENGVLTVSLPKAAEAKARTIEVKS